MSSYIEFEHVSFAYDAGAKNALDDISLSIEQGEFICILGANGSGKSTLARHINGLLNPSEGVVRVNGWDVSDEEHLYDVRSRVGMVFQNPENQTVASLVEDDVAFGPENLGLPSAEIRRRVDAALECVHMQDFAKREVSSLSGGQKQRIAIAGALAMEPQILVLDEPAAMLDVRGRRGIMRVLNTLREQGMTIVLVTHFIEDALDADKVLVMNEGHIELCGTPDEVLTQSERLRELNLRAPFALLLCLELNKQGFNLKPCLKEEEVIEQLCR